MSSMVKYFLEVEYKDGRVSEGWSFKTTRKAEAKKKAKELFTSENAASVSLYAHSKDFGLSFQGTAYSVEELVKW